MRDQHLPYELLMLRESAEILSGPEPSTDNLGGTVRRWMAIEGFYIHLRNLDAFFYGGGGKELDAFATHFFGDPAAWQASGRRPKRSREMRRAVDLAGTMVAHLSYDRQTHIEAGRHLQWVQLAREMNAVFEAFQVALSNTQNRIPVADDFRIVPVISEIEYGPATTASTPGNITEYLKLLHTQSRDPEE